MNEVKLTKRELENVLSVYGELRKLRYDVLNTFLGSITIDDMNRLYLKLKASYDNKNFSNQSTL